MSKASRRPAGTSTPTKSEFTAPRDAGSGTAWSWLVLLSIVPLLLHSLGAPLGEPFADDFDYLYRALLVRHGSWFDGYGSTLYWRPLGRQVYFGLLAPVIVAHPRVIVALHVGLLLAAALLVYRALRVRWTVPAAATAASFLLFSESTRMLIAWPSHFMDLGAIVCACLAIHEAAHRRMHTALLAMLASLSSKEVGVLVVPLLAWLPAGRSSTVARARWSAAAVAMAIAWATLYFAVCRHAGLTVAQPAQGDPAAAAVPLLTRYAWAFWNSARAAFSLSALPGRGDAVVGFGLGAITLGAVIRFAVSRPARSRVAPALPWIGWGLAWYALATVALVAVYPAWAPYRSAFASIGLGVALAALLSAAHPALLGGLVVVRLAALAMSPGPPPDVSLAPEDNGAAFDFPRLVRLERLVSAGRDQMTRRYAELPRGSVVVLENLPRLTEYAFGGDLALRLWYRDTTLRMVRMAGFQRDSTMKAAAILEYEMEGPVPLALIEPAAMRSLLGAFAAVRRTDWPAVLAGIERADSLQPSRDALGFESALASTRSVAMLGMGDTTSAAAQARQSLSISPHNREARWMLVRLGLASSRAGDAAAQLDTLLRQDSADSSARQLRERLRMAGVP